ncbi:MAG: S8 family serine peptidase [Desulfosarcinaceae bacterium]
MKFSHTTISNRLRGLASAAAIVATLLCGTALADEKESLPYEDGQETEELIVYLAPGANPKAFGERFGLKWVRSFASDVDAHVFSAGDVKRARHLLDAVRASKAVIAAFNNRLLVAEPSFFPVPENLLQDASKPDFGDSLYISLPNDPYFDPDPATPHEGQWHLDNSSGYTHIHAPSAWGEGATGSGVVIGVVDSGVDSAHPDLRLVPRLGYDFVTDGPGGDPDPSVGLNESFRRSYAHGTAVAGVAAGFGGNGLGVSGVAPFARVAALRVPLTASYKESDLLYPFADTIVDAIHFGNSGIPIKNHSYIAGGYFANWDSLVYALRQTTAAGMIHVAGAGNGAYFEGIHYRHDVNTKPYAIPEVIQVAAVNAEGRYSYYSNFGAAVMVTAPSSGKKEAELPGIVTTDVTGDKGINIVPGSLNAATPWEAKIPDVDYRENFGGTSAAAPVVTGVLALAEQVRPDLSTRMAKHLLAQTSHPIDIKDKSQSSDGGWRTNTAGCRFNQNYGFGVVDAQAVAKLAAHPGLSVSAGSTLDSSVLELKSELLDDDRYGNAVDIDMSHAKTGPLEEVGVTLDIDHAAREQLEISLVSPSGTRSRVLSPLPAGTDSASSATEGIHWTFWSHAFWGEPADGIWIMIVRDTQPGTVGMLNAAQLHLRTGMLTLNGDRLAPCEKQTDFAP